MQALEKAKTSHQQNMQTCKSKTEHIRKIIEFSLVWEGLGASGADLAKKLENVPNVCGLTSLRVLARVQLLSSTMFQGQASSGGMLFGFVPQAAFAEWCFDALI